MNDEKEPFSVKIKDFMKTFRFWVVVIFLIASFFAISFSFSSQGIVINGIVPGSPAASAGVAFDPHASLRNLERIENINGQRVPSIEEYFRILEEFDWETPLQLETNRGFYLIEFTPGENVSFERDLGISVRTEPRSNIRLGIELEGGSRLILQTEDILSPEDYDLLVNTVQSRLDVFGASGTRVNKLEDAFSDNQFIIVESISSNVNDVFELIQRQGEFEATILNETVFTGDNINRVLIDPQNSFLQGCSESGGQFVCTYTFSIVLDSEGADNFFAKTSQLDIVNGQLSERVYFFLDGDEITSLSIASSFKFQRVTRPQISVSGDPAPTRDLAIANAQREARYLQTILSTQSLPTELTVVQSFSISSNLGEQLLENAVLLGFIALIVVAGVVALRYREPVIFFAIFAALLVEVIIVFGLAAFLKLSIDLAAIGGLIAAIGSGVDDQIIMTDEYFRKRKKQISSRKRVKNAIYIIMIAYLTTLAAMVPLYFAGLQILQGFAFMIIVGITVGVLITRPAYAAFLRIYMTTRKQRQEEDEEER